MISQKMLITMYEYSYFLITGQIEGISHQDSLLQPPGSCNPANWILGHIITSRCNVLAMLGLPPVWDFSRCKPFIPGSDPYQSNNAVEDFELMKGDLEKTQELLLAEIQQITKEKLLKISEDQTIGEQLASYGIHEAFHAGELAIIRQTFQEKEDV